MPAELALLVTKSKQSKPLPFREPMDFARAIRLKLLRELGGAVAAR